MTRPSPPTSFVNKPRQPFWPILNGTTPVPLGLACIAVVAFGDVVEDDAGIARLIRAPILDEHVLRLAGDRLT